ncbi:MAG: MinD/ParA family protein [Lachnospiraceae bacterium]|nr:MinD/ParA family protein [Lachnospiraceae bacterium]
MDQASNLRNIIKQRNAANANAVANTADPASGHARVITVTSGKGGVGKSNTTVNLAVQFSKKGKKVIIFDADIGLANVEVMFGAIPSHILSDVIFRGMSIKDVITPGPLDIGFISGGSGVVGLSNISKDQVIYLVKNLAQLDSMADIILIDTGAGISDQVMEFVFASSEIILVSTPEPSSLTDSYSLLKTLYKSPKFDRTNAKVNVIANRATSSEDGDAVYQKLNTVVDRFLGGSLNYLGLVPQDPAIDAAIRAQKAVSLHAPKAPESKAYECIAGNLLSGEYSYYNMSRGIAGLISGLFGR